MTTYKELFGKYVQNVSSDPTSTDAEGQIWYNATSGTFKTALGSYGVWSAGGTMSTARRYPVRAGTQTAALASMGGPPQSNATEKYNGTSWTTGNNTNNSSGAAAGDGVQTAAIVFGGETPGSPGATITELYNGTTWTNNPTGLNTGRRDLAGFGIQTATVAAGGALAPNALTNATEKFNGTTWTSSGNLSQSKREPKEKVVKREA
jgi:hypothetical protein